jgi:uncharacterized membrane protein
MERIVTGLLLAASAFFLIHLIPSTPLRREAVAIAGERGYLGIFAILSLGALIWMITQFNTAPYGSKLWLMPDWWLWLKAALTLLALILAICGILSPNPSSPGAEKLLANVNASEGVFAITRHPVMWGAAIWAVTHAISIASVRGLLFFGSFAATALIGSWLQQRRKRANNAAWAAFEARTSFFPFAAVLERHARLSLHAIGWRRIALGTLAWAAILYFHARLFGAYPLPNSILA